MVWWLEWRSDSLVGKERLSRSSWSGHNDLYSICYRETLGKRSQKMYQYTDKGSDSGVLSFVENKENVPLNTETDSNREQETNRNMFLVLLDKFRSAVKKLFE